ncbi:MAG: OmpA family protein [Pseudomonadota bacterium]|nr:hypothetical protein [Pseudomonadales bacterium]MDY6920273.1 OmpA family protein [Pseudomonadota bacterium]
MNPRTLSITLLLSAALLSTACSSHSPAVDHKINNKSQAAASGPLQPATGNAGPEPDQAEPDQIVTFSPPPVSVVEAAPETTPDYSPQPDSGANNQPEQATQPAADPLSLVVAEPDLNEENAPAAGPQAALTTSPTYPAPTEPPQPVRFHFGFDRKTLDDKDAAALQQHAEFLAAHPQVQLNINGHADAQGDPRYNQHLAQRRAEYVAELLIEAGAAPNQLKVLGWGADAPAPDAAHPRDNRRVELIYNEAHLATLQGE